jgi:hypothetical protein
MYRGKVMGKINTEIIKVTFLFLKGKVIFRGN